MKNPKVTTCRTVQEKLLELSPRDFETSLANLHAQIGQWIAEYGHDAKLDWDPDFYYSYDPSPSPRFLLLRDRPETNEEIDARVAAESAAQAARLERERAEFRRLKQQFGDK